MSALTIPPPWTADALCAQTDGEAFFPERGGSNRPAKRVCRRCPVMVECLEFALDNAEPFGVWGGLSGDERRKVLRRRGGPDAAVRTVRAVAAPSALARIGAPPA